MSAKIVSGFPGIGKTYLTYNANNKQIYDASADCAQYFWMPNQLDVHPLFPNNYIEYLLTIKYKYEIIFTPFIYSLSDVITNFGFKHTIVYPIPELKETYLMRYKQRGDSALFIKLVDMKWKEYYKELNLLKIRKVDITFIELFYNDSYIQLETLR